MTPTKTRKGDVVLIERRQRTFTIGAGTTERTDYVVMLVSSASRDGTVTKVSDSFGDKGYAIPTYWDSSHRWILPASDIDVAGLLAAFEARAWPGERDYHHGRYPFDTFEEAKAFCAPFRLQVDA